MKYTLTIQRRVIKILEKIQEPDYSKIKKAILALAENPRPSGYIKLTNRPGYRIRAGNYRIIYDIRDRILTIDVVELGHRKDIYV